MFNLEQKDNYSTFKLKQIFSHTSATVSAEMFAFCQDDQIFMGKKCHCFNIMDYAKILRIEGTHEKCKKNCVYGK